MAEIATRGLTKSFGRVAALRGVDLEIPKGSLWAVAGADGAGKTTLLRCIAGLCRPDSGAVEPGAGGRLRIGFARQGARVYRDLTVEENVRFFASMYGVEPGDVLAFVGLENDRDRLGGQLSGGMQQRLSLACALVHRPAVMLLDEPTTGVDPVSRRDFWRLIEDMRGGGATILLATAYLDEAERCEHVVLLHEGRVIARGAPDALRRGGTLEEAFLAAM